MHDSGIKLLFCEFLDTMQKLEQFLIHIENDNDLIMQINCMIIIEFFERNKFVRTKNLKQ